jgi:hypothetical protein
MTRRQNVTEPEFPADTAPRGLLRPPMMLDRDPSKVGL